MNLRSKKFWFSVASFLLLIGGLFAALILVQRKQLIEKKAVEPTATLAFGITSFDNLNPADPVNANIILDPGGQEVVAVDVAIEFSKDVLELVRIDPSQAKADTNFKTFAPIVSQTDCTFNPDINTANQIGKLSFGAVTFDCSADGGNGATTAPVNDVVNPLAWLHFKVRDDALAGATGTISFYYNPAEPTTDSNVVLNPTGDTIEDILLEPTSTVTVTVAGGGPPPTECGNGVLDPGEVCDPEYRPNGKWCGGTGEGENDNLDGCYEQCVDKTSGRYNLCKSDCTYELRPYCSSYCGGDPLCDDFKEIGVDECAPGKVCNEQCQCVTLEPDKAQLNFQIKFQGIEHQGHNKTVRVILKQGDEEKYKFDSVGVTSNEAGVYSGTISNLDPGTYDIYFKEQSHLQTKFASVILNAGANTQDWSSTALITGDADDNNVVNIQDFRVLVETFDQTGENLAADFNGNRTVDIQDFIFIKINYDLVGD